MDDRFLEDLKARVDLVAVIGRYTELKKSGKNYMCRSPFRNERTASFSVSPEKQVWYDFGSSEGGDAITFIEKIENVSFQEAIEILADMVGVEVPKDQKQSASNKEQKKDIFQLHKAAAEFFVKQLQGHEKAKSYLEDRGLGSVSGKWQLGYGGDTKDGLSKFLLKQGFSEKLISESGVSFERQFGDKSIQDRFWGRVMIPIQEPRNGDIVAFSGRDILDREKVGKYINSPENPVYHKSATLFGLYQSRKKIREKDQIIFVEGNFDVVTMHEHGFDQTVATCGTALTEDHLRITKRLTRNIILAFDTDIAGKKATLRAMEMALLMDLNPFILVFEGEAKDIDEFLQTNDAKIIRDQLKKPRNALEFLLEKLLAKFLETGVEGRKKILSQFFYFLNVCPRPMEVDYFLEKLSEGLKTSKSVMDSEFEKYQAEYKKPTPSQLKPKESVVKKYTKQEQLLGFIFTHWRVLKITFEKQAEAYNQVLALLSGDAKRFFEVLSEGALLAPEDKLTLQSWSMAYENHTQEEDPSITQVQQQMNLLLQAIKKEQDQKTRVDEAKALGEKLRK